MSASANSRDTCRSCGAKVIWATTDSDKRMPVDAEPDSAGTLRVSRDAYGQAHVKHDPYAFVRHRPHFATCPDSESWRKR